jgi:predicted phage gp36 major capsid-like protein
MTTEEVRFTRFLSAPRHEIRAMGESTGSDGGFLVPQRFYEVLIGQMREYGKLMAAFELWETEDGETYERPVFAQFGAAAATAENTQMTDSPLPTLAQQSWGQTPMYPADFPASWQLVQDSFRYPTPASGWAASPASPGNSAPLVVPAPHPALDQFVAKALGKFLGRSIAPVTQSALYAAILAAGAVSDSGGFLALTTSTPITWTVAPASGAATELGQNTVTLDTAAQMIEAVDEAYLDNASFYMSRKQWVGVQRQVSATDKKVQVNVSSGRQMLYGCLEYTSSHAPTSSEMTTTKGAGHLVVSSLTRRLSMRRSVRSSMTASS